MNKIFAILLTSMFLIVGNAQANCGKCGIGDAPKADVNAMITEKVEMLTKELKLNDEQKMKVEALINEKMAKKQEMREQKLKAMEALHEEFKTKLSSILTAEQMTSWETMMKNPESMMAKCPMCKDGKMCEMCLLKKKKMAQEPEEHEHADGHMDK
jgi:hypothetical protein